MGMNIDINAGMMSYDRAINYEFKGMAMTRACARNLVDYINYGTPTRGFLHAIITNNLGVAVALIDDWNIHDIPAYVNFLYNRAPLSSWGSPGAYENWVARGGLWGIALNAMQQELYEGK